MYSKIKILLLAFFIFLSNVFENECFAQIYEDDEPTNEMAIGLNFNTNGGFPGGIFFRYSPNINQKLIKSGQIEFVNVRHPKEIKTPSSISGNSYIFGKMNYLFVLRSQFCFEKVLFRKDPNEGVQINALVGLGPSFGIIKPYHIIYEYNKDQFRNEPFDPQKHYNVNRIAGSGGMLSGVGNSKLTLGANFKSSLNFEFGTFGNGATGVEIGFLAEAFPEYIYLVPWSPPTRKYFISGFINLYYGWRR
jgi:hypothetical protein